MDYIFVAVPTRYGRVKIVGPITGIEWQIRPRGTWIADEFERDERTVNIEVTRYCFKSRSFIKEKPIFIARPSVKDLDEMPGG